MTKNFKSNYDWAKNVEEDDALQLFERMSSQTLLLMEQGEKDLSITICNELESLLEAYNSHLSDNKAFYYGNRNATNYINNLQQKLANIKVNTNDKMLEIFNSNKVLQNV